MSAGKDREPGFDFDPCSMRFRDSSLEAEFLENHVDTIMRTSPRIYAIPSMTMIIAIGICGNLVLRESAPLPSYMIGFALLSPTSFAGVFFTKKCGGRGFKEFLRASQAIMCMSVILTIWLPYWQQASGVCEQQAVDGPVQTENGMPANCNLVHAGQAPVPTLIGTIITPSMLAVIFGMQWVPVVGVFIIMNVPAVYYVHTHQAVEQGVCMMSYLVCSGIVLMMTAAVIKQERETFVWRKKALSEKKVELERTFNAFLCHEIRNPFAVIKGFAECVTFPDVEPSVHSPPRSRRVLGAINRGDGGNNRQLVQHILDSCTHIQRILDNSLDLGKLEQHKLVLDDDAVNIKSICDQIRSMLVTQLKPAVQLLVSAPDVSFRGDRTRWTQLLLNLVNNSIKFTKVGVVKLDITADELSPGDCRWSRVIGADTKQYAVSVKVIDTGCGISEEGQAILFHKYQQVHGKKQRKGPEVSHDAGSSGTGLGLVISQHIVHLMGCSAGISVTSPCRSQESNGSTEHGPGSMFSFSVVPLGLEFSAPQLASACIQSAGVHSDAAPLAPALICKHVKVSIMVVDDELLNRMVLLSKLKQCGERVHARLGAAGVGVVGGELDSRPFEMDIVQAEHAEMALVMMHDRLEERQKQADFAAMDDVYVDIIILDEHMQSSGGILKGTEAIPHIRQLAQKLSAKQPVIVLSSGNCSQADQQLYTETGADATWPKPYPTGDAVVESLVEWVTKACRPDGATRRAVKSPKASELVAAAMLELELE
jgi:signal transduction histidine kinase/CheY-like chemotaxis protein